MNKYELLYIIDNELEAEAKDALIAKFSDIVVNDGGSVETIDKWGTKKACVSHQFQERRFLRAHELYGKARSSRRNIQSHAYHGRHHASSYRQEVIGE